MTELLGAERSYLDGYGLIDIRNVWLGALAAGGVTGAMASLVPWAIRKRRERLRQREVKAKTPTPNDLPIGLLERLEQLSSQLTLPQAVAQVNGTPTQGFVFPLSDDKGMVHPTNRIGV